MNRLEKIMKVNEEFINNEEYISYQTDKYPDKKMVIFTCMDTRLTQLLPKAMGIRNGDAKIIKNAGALITHPFGSVMRSIVVAIFELGAEEVFVVGHHGCGMSNINTNGVIEKMKESGIKQEVLDTVRFTGIDLNHWLHGFDRVETSVAESVEMIRNHPLIPKNIIVHGLVMNPETGQIDVLIDGNK
ncbi:MAG: carbonic anhydrase [Clostridiales bacterium]|nr:carbonic anhydrase [Clostridiales bacterium]